MPDDKQQDNQSGSDSNSDLDQNLLDDTESLPPRMVSDSKEEASYGEVLTEDGITKSED